MPPIKKAAKSKSPKIEPNYVSDRSAIASMVIDGLRSDFSKDDDATFVSDYLRQDPITAWVSTNSFLLDCAIGYPKGYGLPMPSIVEIVGSEGTGKSSLAYAVMANIQHMGGWSNLIDAEGMFTREYAMLAGLNMDKSAFGYSQMSLLENCLRTIQRTMERHYAIAPDMPLAITLDSVAGCTVLPEKEAEKGEPARALHARILARALRSGITSQMYTKVSVDDDELLVGRPAVIMFINQLKSTMATNPYQQQMDSFGGKGLKYHSRVRLQLDRSTTIKTQDGNVAGFRCKVKVLKNKVSSPFREIEFEFRFDGGIEDYLPVMEFMEKYGFLDRSGNRYMWKGKAYYPSGLRDHMRSHPQDWLEMRQQALLSVEKAWGSNTLRITPPSVGNLTLNEEEGEDEE